MTIRVMFFCLGNICRSPLAEGLFCHHLEAQGLEHLFHVESSGTSAYHVGDPPDLGSQRVVLKHLNLDISHQRAQQLRALHLDEFDVVVAMDESNRSNALRLRPEASVLLLRDFDVESLGDDVPDPYGGGANQFEVVYEMVYRCTAKLLDDLLKNGKLK
jgi:protein-tyrosine phosphatase